MLLAVEALAQRLQHGIRAVQSRGGIDGDNRVIGDDPRGFVGGNDLRHLSPVAADQIRGLLCNGDGRGIGV